MNVAGAGRWTLPSYGVPMVVVIDRPGHHETRLPPRLVGQVHDTDGFGHGRRR